MNPLYVYSYEASFGKETHKTGINKLRKELNITIAVTIALFDYEDVSSLKFNRTKMCESNDQGAFCTYIELEDTGCMKERFVNVQDDQDMNKTLNTILKTPRLSFVVVQGASSLVAMFHRKVSELEKIDRRLKDIYFINFEKSTGESNQNRTVVLNTRWFGHGKKSYDYIYDLPGSLGLNTLIHYIHHIQAHFFTRDFFKTIQKYYSIDEITKILVKKDSKLFAILKFVKLDLNFYTHLPKKIKRRVYEELIYTREIVVAYFTFWRELFYVDIIKLEKVLRLGMHNPEKALKAEPICSLTIPCLLYTSPSPRDRG